MDTSRQSCGSFCLSMMLMKVVESLVYEGKFFLHMVVTNGLQMLICFLLCFHSLKQLV